tara:strand:+ start:4411 stop:4536 length:126 start_codon:yes stop_codon:yes gene_type:complete
MNFEVPESLKKEVNDAMRGIKDIQDQYKGVANFKKNEQKLI